MRYCTLDDLTLAIPARTLTQLSNDVPGATAPDMAVVERGVEFAEQMIDGYLRSCYPLPLVAVPTVVHELTIQIARHWLYARRPEGKDDLPPAVVRGYKTALDTLTAIQKGQYALGIEQSQAAQPKPSKMRVSRSRPRQFGADVLDQYK